MARKLALTKSQVSITLVMNMLLPTANNRLHKSLFLPTTESQTL